MSQFLLKHNTKRGIALFIAVITAGVLLLIAVAISDLSYKEQIITTSAKESKEAFYAADTGLECALYWDAIQGAFVGNTSGYEIFCDGEGESLNQIPLNTTGETPDIEFGDESSPPNSEYCFTVKIYKTYNAGTGITSTRVLSRGYNNCNTSDPRRLERALEANY